MHTFWLGRLRWLPLSKCRVVVVKSAFNFWRRQSWEGEARKHQKMLLQHQEILVHQKIRDGINHAAWIPILNTIPVFKGRSIQYSLQGIIALTQTCTALRFRCLWEIRRCWKQMRGAIVNPVNANALDGVPFLLLVKLVSSAHIKYRRIGVSESGNACSTREQ